MRKIYYNANIVTMEKGAMHADAMLVEDGCFKAVGTRDEIFARVGACEAEDMKGKTILPGFFETHMHNLSEGLI
ncbi:MAG: amidohydrolase, partial [Firmicutes bacterium]|nr:amidohydrolase [Bacillota bacterium]